MGGRFITESSASIKLDWADKFREKKGIKIRRDNDADLSKGPFLSGSFDLIVAKTALREPRYPRFGCMNLRHLLILANKKSNLLMGSTPTILRAGMGSGDQSGEGRKNGEYGNLNCFAGH